MRKNNNKKKIKPKNENRKSQVENCSCQIHIV